MSASAESRPRNRPFQGSGRSRQGELSVIIAETPEEIPPARRHPGGPHPAAEDKMLFGKTVETIRARADQRRVGAEEGGGRAERMFQSLTDSYFRERVRRYRPCFRSNHAQPDGGDPVDIKSIDKRVILVANNLSPAETSQIQLEKIMGFVTDRGGKDSHTSIIARTLEIPAVLALETATATIKNNDILIVDGTEGLVIINPDDETLITYETRASHI
jgi:phosphoenolpyruvate-protein phosphotransferase (PTS system enzyme I)